MGVAGKSLEGDVNDLGREALRAFIDRHFASQKEAADAFGVSQPTVSDYLAGKKGVGAKLLGGVAALDAETALAMMGVDVPAIREEARQLAAPAIETLRGDGYSLRMASWAVWAAYQFGIPTSLDGLLRSARLLAAAAASLGPGSLESEKELPPKNLKGTRRSGR